jgi:peptidoglycan/LPS O-acetylase OafA/YrhL
VAALFIPEEIGNLRGDAVASIFYFNNWYQLISDQSYFAEFGQPSLFRHLWSLSVEEQFYLLWPLLFAGGITLFGRKRLLWGVIAGVIASTLLMAILFVPTGETDRVFYGTDTRAVGLLVGVALALVWNPNDLRGRVSGRYAGWALDALGVIALALIVRDFLVLDDFEAGLYEGGFLLLALFTGLLIAVLAHPASRLGHVLGNKPMVWLGLRSYSFYLWHWPILMLTRPDIDVPISGPFLVILQLGATLVIADISYRYVEEPFRRKRDSERAPSWLGIGRPALAVAVGLTVWTIGWSGIVSTSGEAGDALAQDQPARVIVGEEDAEEEREDAAKGVLAIGDSVMRGASTQLADALGRHAVVDAAEGRQPADYASVVDQYRASGDLPNRVVVQMGNNGPVYYDDIQALKESLEGVPHVYLVNVLVPRSWQAEVISALDEAVETWPEAEVVDWFGTVQGDMLYDGVHVDPDGAEVYADLIADSVREG